MVSAGIDPMGLSSPRSYSLVIFALQIVKKIVKYQPSKYAGVNEIVKNRQNSDIKHPQNIYQLETLSNNMNLPQRPISTEFYH